MRVGQAPSLSTGQGCRRCAPACVLAQREQRRPARAEAPRAAIDSLARVPGAGARQRVPAPAFGARPVSCLPRPPRPRCLMTWAGTRTPQASTLSGSMAKEREGAEGGREGRGAAQTVARRICAFNMNYSFRTRASPPFCVSDSLPSLRHITRTRTGCSQSLAAQIRGAHARGGRAARRGVAHQHRGNLQTR